MLLKKLPEEYDAIRGRAIFHGRINVGVYDIDKKYRWAMFPWINFCILYLHPAFRITGPVKRV